MTSITITRPDDWHLHLRDGAAMRDVLPHTAARFARAIVMPNLRPPVTTTALALAYRERILAALPAGSRFEPLMTLYLTDNTRPGEIAAAKSSRWDRQAVPGPGSWFPSRLDHSAPTQVGCATRRPSPCCRAHCSSTWVGLTSPETSAKVRMSTRDRRRVRLAASPIASCRNVRLRRRADSVSVMGPGVYGHRAGLA